METLRAASPTYSLADRRKELVGRTVSAGPLALRDLHVAAADDTDSCVDPHQQPPILADSPGNLSTIRLDNDNDNEDEDENALEAQFYRQQQLEADDVDAFLVCGLQLELPTTTATVASARKKTTTPRPEALTASMHALTAPRRRRPSSAVLPDGVLHVWVYRACRLSFRQHFESMYDRHGLHVRCYLSWRKQCVRRPVESRRNVGGNMTNPVWRTDDHTAIGHLAVPLGDRLSPESLPANTELVVEIVCGILVVSAAKLSLLEFFQDRRSQQSTDGTDNDNDTNDMNDTTRGLQTVHRENGIVCIGQQWHPLVGQDTGQLEMSLEFVPASVFDDDDDDRVGDSEAIDIDDNDDDTPELGERGDNNNDSMIDRVWLEPTESQASDPTATCDSDTDETYWELERRTLSRKARFECTDALEQTTRESSDVLVSNNGKTTMYIPSQCRQPQSPPPLSFESTNAVVSYTAPPPSRTPSSASERSGDSQMDEQLLNLYLHGISSDGSEPSVSVRLSGTSSGAASQFSLDVSESFDASMYSYQASTCATDVWAYNELIKDMESSLKAAELGDTEPTVRKADAMLRHAAPTTAPHATTATIGVGIPTKSTRKTSKKMTKQRQPSNNNGDNDDDDELHTASSVRETAPVGVVLFDLASIPERLRAGFERSVSDDNMPQRTKKEDDPTKARRRSLPVNSLSLGLARPGPTSASSRGYRPQHVAIDEHDRSDAEIRATAKAESRRRRSSLHSLADLHAKALEDASQRRRRQQQLQRGSTVGGVKPQRRNSNSHSVGGVVLGVGKFINIGNVPGVVRYVGPTEFASGTWIGVELCEKKGKNDGAVRGVKVCTGWLGCDADCRLRTLLHAVVCAVGNSTLTVHPTTASLFALTVSTLAAEAPVERQWWLLAEGTGCGGRT